MRRGALAALALLLAVAPASASGGLACSGEGAAIELMLGRLPVLAVVDARIAVGADNWVTSPHLGEGTTITVGQAFGDGKTIAVDITDEIVNEIVARLRLFLSDSGDAPVIGGVLEMPGVGAWVVSCEEMG
jgi:hypothetical protein